LDCQIMFSKSFVPIPLFHVANNVTFQRDWTSSLNEG
jgi:hypothetical protein